MSTKIDPNKIKWSQLTDSFSKALDNSTSMTEFSVDDSLAEVMLQLATEHTKALKELDILKEKIRKIPAIFFGEDD